MVLQRPVNVTNSMNYDISDSVRSRRGSDSKICGSPDLAVFLIDHLSDGDSVYSGETVFQISGNPMKTSLICTGTLVQTWWNIWQS